MRTSALVTVLVLGVVSSAHAIVVDGSLDPSYVSLATQAVASDPGPDAAAGQASFASGSEIDGAYAAVDAGVLYLFFAGNLKDAICGTGACTDSDLLLVYLDTQPGGQNVVIDAESAGLPVPGLAFDAGFAPDYALQFYASGALSNSFARWGSFGTLPTGGGGTPRFLGGGSNPGAPGTLTGGSNPFGIEATIDNRNTGGVGAGCAAGSGAGVTTGVELAIPLAAIGSPSDCIGLTAMVCQPQHGSVLTNQVIGPLPPGTCALGAPGTVKLAGISGDQFVTFCLPAVPVRTGTWGALKDRYR